MLKFRRSGDDSVGGWRALAIGEVRANQTLRVVTILPCIIIYVFLIIIIRKGSDAADKGLSQESGDLVSIPDLEEL